MRKAYSYIRMSSEKQLKGDSLRRQLELSEQYAKEFNLELVNHINGVDLKDLGVSGYQGVNSKKGVLALFLNALEIGKIPENSVLLVESLDRLSRDEISYALTQFLNIINYNIEIVTLTDNQSYTKETINQNPAQMYISFGVMFRANEESETKSKRIRAAWQNKRNIANIKPLTKIAPAWLRYSEEEQKFLLIEERSKVVKLIFDMCTNTCGLWSIARYLNENNIPTFGYAKIWYKSYINKIIFNRAVIGEFQPHKMIKGKRVADGEAIKEYFPAAITESELLLAHAAIQKRTKQGKGRNGKSFSNLFTKLAFCGHCSSAMIVRNRGVLPKGGKTFICSNKHHGKSCIQQSWKHNEVENAVFKHLHEVNFSDILGSKDNQSVLEAQIQTLATKLTGLSNQIENGIDSLISGGLSDEVKSKLQNKINNLQSTTDEIKDEKSALETSFQDIQMQSKGLSNEDIKKITKLLTEKVDDYYFRSSLHNTLVKFVEKINFIIDDGVYAPWEINEQDDVVVNFKLKNPKFNDYDHRKLLDSAKFKDFYLQYGKRIQIIYKSGAARHILFGHDISIPAGTRHNDPVQ